MSENPPKPRKGQHPGGQPDRAPPARVPAIGTYRPLSERASGVPAAEPGHAPVHDDPRWDQPAPVDGLGAYGHPQHGSDGAERLLARRLAPQRPVAGRREADRGRAPRAGRRSIPLLTVVASLIGVMVAAAAAIATTVALYPPIDFVRDRLVAEVKARTGRDLVIGGAGSVTYFPSLGIRLADVSLSAPPGMGGPPTLRMRSLDVRLGMMQLVAGQISVERLVLNEPRIDARIDAEGRRSWQFASIASGDAGRVRIAQVALPGRPKPLPAELEAFASGSSPNATVKDRGSGAAARAASLRIALADVRIENGSIEYADARSARSERISGLNARLRMAERSGAVDVAGEASVRGEQVTFDAKVASVAALLGSEATKLSLRLGARPFSLTFDGDVMGADRAGTDGAIKLDAPSLAGLMRFAGREAPKAAGPDDVALAGRLRTSTTSIALSDATARLGEMRLGGSATVDLGGKRPSITAAIESPELDVSRVSDLAKALSATASPVAPLDAVVAPLKPVRPAAAAEPKTIGDLIGTVAPDGPAAAPARVKGFTQRAGWSDEPIDVSALAAVDVEARLSLGRTIVQQVAVGASSSTVSLKNGVLQIVVTDAQLYGGRGRATIQLDGTAPQAAIGANVLIDGVAAGPLLKDAAGFEGLTGRSRLSLALSARGSSERQLVATLGGKAELMVGDGAIVGYDLSAILRQLAQLQFRGLDRSASEQTSFQELAATFAVTNGVAETADLRVVSPEFRLTGAGQVALPPRTLDLKLRARLLTAAANPGSAIDLSGIELPARLTGSWDRPVLQPDAGAATEVLKDPSKAAAVVRQIGERLKGSKAESVVRQFLGGNSTAGSSGGKPAGGQAQGQKPDAGKLLEQLFKP